MSNIMSTPKVISILKRPAVLILTLTLLLSVVAPVVVVKDGQLFLAKGYGYADAESKIPVDAETTMFKIRSLSRLFTWTALMRLAEQGELDLDADINTYPDFSIPDTYAQPITLAHLMVNTSGFEDIHADLVKWDEADLAPPREWLASQIPARVRPPGDVAAFSNYNVTLAGYIVARDSGGAYSEYVQEHILTPPGMTSTTTQYPTPPELRAQESAGCVYEDDYQTIPQLLTPEDLYPAGGMRASATEKARFMVMHLQGGFYGNAALLGSGAWTTPANGILQATAEAGEAVFDFGWQYK